MLFASDGSLESSAVTTVTDTLTTSRILFLPVMVIVITLLEAVAAKYYCTAESARAAVKHWLYGLEAMTTCRDTASVG